MRVLEGPFAGWEALPGPASVTMGVMDGVHLGHRALISALPEGMAKTVLTFDPHPIAVLSPGSEPDLLTTIEERLRLLEGAGADQVGALDLREIRDLGPEEFVERVLVEALSAGAVVVGPDFRFGRDRRGDAGLLAEMGRRHGYEVATLALVEAGGEAVSSSRIREMIRSGRVGPAEELMGSRYTLSGPVVGGERRGRDLGYPTANIEPPRRKVLPGDGVYACHATVGGKRWAAAVNVGVRPTFGDGKRLVEAHLLDFGDDVYGEVMELEFVRYLRPELAFDEVSALISQMGDDVAAAREILASAPSSRG